MKYLILAISLFVSTASIANEYDVSKPWDNAEVHVPNSFFAKSISSVNVVSPMPVVIYMHGCSGINADSRQWASFVKKQGYIVVMLDSFAMPGRTSNCPNGQKLGSDKTFPAKKVRPAEARYALTKVKEQPWADKNNIFLMGHSEGGLGAAQSKAQGFKGVIISGYNCKHGLQTNPNIPVLAIQHEVDPWLADNDKCSSRWGDRANAVELVIAGSGHSTSHISLAKDAVSNFLKNNTQ